MALKIKVDKSLCVSVASCVVIATNTFELDEEGLAQVKNPTGDSDKIILQAAQSCPVNAIVVFDNSGKKLYPKM